MKEKIRLITVLLLTAAVLLSGCGSGADMKTGLSGTEEPGVSEGMTEGTIHEALMAEVYTMPSAGEALVSSRHGMSGTAPEDTDGVSDPVTSGSSNTVSENENASAGQTQAVSEDAADTSDTADTAEPSDDTASADVRTSAGGGRIVCIDAGHQSHQNSEKEPIGPGASETKIKVAGGTSGTTTGVPEYQLTLAVALKLQNELTLRGYTVVMCRTTNDVNISNAERAQIANSAGAGAFIRIHANGSDNSGVSGALSMAPSSSNPYCSSIAASSQILAKDVINGFCAKTGAKNKGVSITDSMSGINWCTVPVTIIEMGFMTNPAEDLQMEDDNYQELMAEGIADGVDAFFAGR